MADSVIGVDIDDVLASIRRLVGDGSSGGGPPLSKSSEARSDQGQPERLVLTSALRVAGEAAPPSGPDILTSKVDDASLPSMPVVLPHTPAVRLTGEAEDFATGRSDACEPDGSEGQDLHWSLGDAGGSPAFPEGGPTGLSSDTDGSPNAGVAINAEAKAILDDDALRLLVAEVVRQELQGALGERITRNVRKLVRREIYRVLASQDGD